MRTEIVIPFAFDTAPMEEFLKEQGLDEVKNVIKDTVKDGLRNILPKKYSYGYGSSEPSVDWKRYLDDTFRSWLDDHSQEVIDEAALLLAARVGRKKAWRDLLAEIKEDSDEG